MLNFSAMTSHIFKQDTTAKFHRLKEGVQDHLLNLGCIHRHSLEMNEKARKEFKFL